MATPTNTDDVVDVRDVIARVEDLRGERETFTDGQDVTDPGAARTVWDATDEGQELAALESFLGEMEGNGGAVGGVGGGRNIPPFPSGRP